MRRTINEDRAWTQIVSCIILQFLGVFLLIISVRFRLIITGAMGIAIYLSSIMVLCYGFYSLGWEYKRISLIEDAQSHAKVRDRK